MRCGSCSTLLCHARTFMRDGRGNVAVAVAVAVKGGVGSHHPLRQPSVRL